LLTGILLILLGAILLLYRFDPALGIAHLFRTYWPLLIILWGVSRLVEHLAPRQQGTAPPAFLSGGEAALLVVVIAVLCGMAAIDIVHRKWPDVDIDLAFSPPFTQTQNLAPQTLPPGAHLDIRTNHGNITVHSGGGNELIITEDKSAPGPNESAADDRMKKADVSVTEAAGGYYTIRSTGSDGQVTMNLDVEVPKDIQLVATANHGDVSVTGVGGAIQVEAKDGSVEIHDAGADVAVTLQKHDTHIVGVNGDVSVAGHGNEIEIGNVTGDATLSGNFYGPVRASNIGKTFQCTAMESELSLEHLTGTMVLDSGRIEVSGATGAANITTRHKDISVENVAGRLGVTDSHGDIEVRYSKPPREEVNIQNETGEVDLVLPPNSSFEIAATSRSGDAQSDFSAPSLNLTSNGEVGALSGRIGTGGPKISIATTYGTIHLRKTT
jgi:hypothetical protein